MANFQVSYLVTDWITIDLKAKNESDAKEKAQKKIDKLYYQHYNRSKVKKTGISCIDGKTEYIGTTNLTLTGKTY